MPGARRVAGVVARRPLPAAGIAVVAPRPVLADPAGDLVAGVAAALAELVAERRRAGRGSRGTCRGGGSCRPRSPPAGRPRVWPGNDVQPMPTASRAWASLLPTWARPWSRGEADDGLVPRPAERGRVEGLERVGADRGSASSSRPPQRPRLGAQRIRHQRVGRDGQAALVVDLGDGRRASTDRASRAVRPSASRWPPSVVTSSPTMTSSGRPRSWAMRPAGDGGIDAFVVGDGDDVEAAASTARSSTRVTDAVPSEATVWMCRSARPAGSAPSAVVASRRGLQVRPDREEDRPPLLGGVLDEPFEGGGERGHRGRDAFAPGALGRHRRPGRDGRGSARARCAGRSCRRRARRSRRRASRVPSASSPAPRTAGSGCRRRSGRGRRRARPGSRSGARPGGPPRLAQADELDAVHAARPLEPGLQAGIVDRLHRRDRRVRPGRRGTGPAVRPIRSAARRTGRPCRARPPRR